MRAEPSTEDRPTIDSAQYRHVMGHYPTGVTVVTGVSPVGDPVGMVVGTFTSVSLDPPLVAFLPATASGTYALLRDSPALCVNVLAHDQLDLCRLMAVPRPGKFDEVGWSMSGHGAPMLHDAVAYIHCSTHEVITAGDHHIVLCRVRAMEVARPATPLLFFQGGYGGFSPRGMAAKGDADVIAALRLAEVARPQVERVARALRCEATALVRVNEHELTTAVSAYGGAAEMRAPLGERIPLAPPLGEAYVAWSAEDVVAAWLGRATRRTPEAVAAYRRGLCAVRERGYAVSGTNAQAGVEEHGTYDLESITVPVLGPDGRAVLCLRATQLAQGVAGPQVKAWIATLRQAATAAARALAGRGQDEYTAYLDALPGDFMM